MHDYFYLELEVDVLTREDCLVSGRQFCGPCLCVIQLPVVLIKGGVDNKCTFYLIITP
jgi:hypothetical protein